MSEEKMGRLAWIPLAAVVGISAAVLAGCGGGGGGSTTTSVDLSHANLQPSDLPRGWTLAAEPQDSLSKHVFVCLDLLGGGQPSTAMSATGPGQLTMISDVLGWATAASAQRASTRLRQGSAEAKGCVTQSLHYVVPAFGQPRPSQARGLTGSKNGTLISYAVSGPSGAPRGVLAVTTRGRATSLILLYRQGKQPVPPNLLLRLFAASASQRLAAATPSG